MNLKRGILIGLALYFSVFVLGVIVTIISRATLDSPQNMPTTYWLITIVSTVMLTCFASIWYFSRARRNIAEGFKLGLTFIIVGSVLDLLFFIPLFIAGPGPQMLVDYYTTPSFYITLALVVASTVFVGSMGQQQTQSRMMQPTQVRHENRSVSRSTSASRRSQSRSTRSRSQRR